MPNLVYGFSRRWSSASTAVRKNSDSGSFSPSTAFTRAIVPSRKRAVIASPVPGALMRGRPMRGPVDATGKFVEGCILLPPPIDEFVATNYIGDTNKEGKATMAPEFEIHPTTSRPVQAWMDYNDVASAPKPVALMRRDTAGRLQVWSWHVTELGAKRAAQNAANNRVVR